MDDLTEQLTRLLFESSFMTLATADAEGKPWASPVEFACDEQLRFYWSSHRDSRHSRNVRANPRVAMSIYDSTQTPGTDSGIQCLYAEGQAEEFRPADLDDMSSSLDRWIEWRDAARLTPRRKGPAGRLEGDTPWRRYRLVVTNFYALDPRGHPDFPGIRIWRVSLDLTEAFTRAHRSRLV